LLGGIGGRMDKRGGIGYIHRLAGGKDKEGMEGSLP